MPRSLAAFGEKELGVTRLPSQWVSAGYGVPRVCARHGEPVQSHAPITFNSRPPLWSIPFAVFGFLPFLIVVALTRKTVTVAAWPFCDICRSVRGRRIAIGWGLVTAGLAGFFLGGMFSDLGDAVSGSLMFGGFLVLFAGVIVAGRGQRVIMASGVVSRDGQFVEFKKADPRFAAQVDATVAAVTQPA